MTKQQILDLYFLDARHKLIELAAFLDRVERADGKDDFRLKAFRAALTKLGGNRKNKAKEVLLAFSDPTVEPIAKAQAKARVALIQNNEIICVQSVFHLWLEKYALHRTSRPHGQPHDG